MQYSAQARLKSQSPQCFLNCRIIKNYKIFSSGSIWKRAGKEQEKDKKMAWDRTGKQRLTALLLSIAMLVQLLPAAALKAWSQETDLNAIEVTADDTTWSDGTYVVRGEVTVSARIKVDGVVTLVLEAGSVLNAEKGITVGIYDEFTITGSGKLIATAEQDQSQGVYAAGIGGYTYRITGTYDYDYTDANAGEITINGGTIIAKGGYLSAGIGGGREGCGATLTVNGGTVEATGYHGGAGIGGGYYGIGGVFMATGGNVTATGVTESGTGVCGAGIGGGYNASSGWVFIYGGTVNATGGENAAGIGSSMSGTCSIIEIGQQGGAYDDLHVTATGGIYAAGIGGGNRSTGGSITIYSGTVTAIGGTGAAGIGGGFSGGTTTNKKQTVITIAGGFITALGGAYQDGKKTYYGAGIGGAYIRYVDDFGNQTASTATTTANNTAGSAIVVTNSVGDRSDQSNWRALIVEKKGEEEEEEETDGGCVYGTSEDDPFILDTDLTIPEGYSLRIPEGGVLAVQSGVTLTNGGEINVNGMLQLDNGQTTEDLDLQTIDRPMYDDTGKGRVITADGTTYCYLSMTVGDTTTGAWFAMDKDQLLPRPDVDGFEGWYTEEGELVTTVDQAVGHTLSAKLRTPTPTPTPTPTSKPTATPTSKPTTTPTPTPTPTATPTQGTTGSGSGTTTGSSSGGGDDSGGLIMGAAAVAALAVGGALVMSRWGSTLAQNTLIGVAYDAEGTLLPGVAVTVQYVKSNGKLVTAQTTMTDADGVYEVMRPIGHYLVTAMYNDSATGQKRTLVLVNEEGPFTIGQTRIIGIARDANGKVLAGATVRLQSVSASGALSTTQTTMTNASGRYEVYASSDKYIITAEYTDRSTGKTRTIKLRGHLDAQTRMGGVATDLNGKVLAGATVIVQSSQSNGVLTTVQTTTTDSNGRYEITRPSGSYLVTAQYTDRATGEKRTVMLVPGELD
jgi:hypothetical protein